MGAQAKWGAPNQRRAMKREIDAGDAAAAAEREGSG
jgi:hypothetical protein